MLYNYIHLQQQPRGRNLNAPVNGVRPDPRFANVIEVVTDTEIKRRLKAAAISRRGIVSTCS